VTPANKRKTGASHHGGSRFYFNKTTPMAFTFDDNFDDILSGIDTACRSAVDEEPRAAVETAKQLAPVDTSALQNSIHAETPEYSGYDDASAAARAANPQVELDTRFPLNAEFENQDGHYGGVVDVPVSYAGYVEEGSQNLATGETVPATHFLERAGDAHADSFADRIEANLNAME